MIMPRCSTHGANTNSAQQSPNSPNLAQQSPNSIRMSFIPSEVCIKTNGTVTWVNDSTTFHTISSGNFTWQTNLSIHFSNTQSEPKFG